MRGDGSGAPPSIAIDFYRDGLYLWSFRGESWPGKCDARQIVNNPPAFRTTSTHGFAIVGFLFWFEVSFL